MYARVRVPATSANLGPGYDSFGLALALHNEFEATLAPAWRITIGGEGAGALSADANNELIRAMRRAFAESGHPEYMAEVACYNGIPLGIGLGSSAAAIVGGLVLGNAIAGGTLPPERILEIATAMEGHADNAAAALYGGFTVAVSAPEGISCSHVDPAGGVAAVVVMGEHPLSTAVSRLTLPGAVPHTDAVLGAGRAALVALGLALGDARALSAGLHDVLHEQYRAGDIPDLEPIRELFTAVGVGPAVLSGSGPTVIAFVLAADDETAIARAHAYVGRLRPVLAGIGRTRVLALGIDRAGARLL